MNLCKNPTVNQNQIDHRYYKRTNTKMSTLSWLVKTLQEVACCWIHVVVNAVSRKGELPWLGGWWGFAQKPTFKVSCRKLIVWSSISGDSRKDIILRQHWLYFLMICDRFRMRELYCSWISLISYKPVDTIIKVSFYIRSRIGSKKYRGYGHQRFPFSKVRGKDVIDQHLQYYHHLYYQYILLDEKQKDYLFSPESSH